MKFFNRGKSLRLPSQECYNIMQDKKGYIWIGTENGLCRYDGTKIKLFNKANGLPEKSVYCVKEDKNGDIRLITSGNRILKVAQDSLIEQAHTTILRKMMPTGFLCYDLNFTAQKDFAVNTQGRSFLLSHNGMKGRRLRGPDTTVQYTLMAQDNTPYIIKTGNLNVSKVNFRKDTSYNFIFDFRSASGSKKLVIPFTLSEYPDWKVKVCKVNKTIFINLDNRLIKVEEDLSSTVYTLPSRILSMYKDSYDGLWIGLFQKGVLYYKDTERMQDVKTSLEEYSVTGTLMDTEGGLWCTTLEKDVFYCTDIHMMDYSNISQFRKPASLLKYINGAVCISTAYNQLAVLRNDLITFSSENYHITTEFTDAAYYKNRLYVSNKSGITVMDKDYHMFKPRVPILLGSQGTFQMDTFHNTLYELRFLSIMKVEDTVSNVFNKFTSRPKCFMVYNDSLMYAGTQDGLYLLNTRRKSSRKIKGISSPVTKIIKTKNGSIWVATKGEGLFTLTQQKATPVNLKQAGATDLFTDLEEDGAGNLWAASNNGLLKIVPAKDTAVYEFNTDDGLLSDNVLQIALDPKTVFISTPEGLCSIPLDSKVINTTPPPVFVHSLKVNDQLIDLKRGKLVFPYQDNSLTISFDALRFKSGKGPVLLYKFSDQDEAFKTANQTELVFDNLEPDTYELTVYALNNDGIKSEKPVVLRFEILKPFWLTGWFILSCLLLFGVTLVLVAIKRVRIIRRKEEEKTRIGKLISESQLSALQAQMSPHFIFNAINSIQNYILKNDEKEAYSYLAKFSKLIRMVLNNSRENILALHTELETLKLYIELEQLRFKNSFVVEWCMSDEIDEHTVSIPTMLIQPYVENAIWHGLMNLEPEQKGLLKLGISKEDHLLKIIVEDNGIGREKANAYKKENLHNPVAMKLIEQRLSIIKEMEGYEKINVTVTDLYDGAGKGCGTLVELYLPLTLL